MLYQNLLVWQRSRLLSIDVYKTLLTCRDYGFKDQITRSALSVPSNIAEGCERETIKERHRFISIAKGSMGEFNYEALSTDQDDPDSLIREFEPRLLTDVKITPPDYDEDEYNEYDLSIIVLDLFNSFKTKSKKIDIS